MNGTYCGVTLRGSRNYWDASGTGQCLHNIFDQLSAAIVRPFCYLWDVTHKAEAVEFQDASGDIVSFKLNGQELINPCLDVMTAMTAKLCCYAAMLCCYDANVVFEAMEVSISFSMGTRRSATLTVSGLRLTETQQRHATTRLDGRGLA